MQATPEQYVYFNGSLTKNWKCAVTSCIGQRYMFGITLLKRMDETAFLGFNAWDFCVRSLAQPYGRLFLRSVILRHPLRTLTGLMHYRKRLRSSQHSDIAPIGLDSEERYRDAFSNGHSLLGLGFCQKPLDPPCPAGRFNHRCLVLEQANSQTIPAACIDCPIRETALRGLRAGASIYIMTSAIDIARDLLLPNHHSPYSSYFLSVCPYSIPPLTLAMSICGLRGLVFAFGRGDCLDYTAWLNADRGTKSEQTFLSSPAQKKLMEVLDTNGGPHDAPTDSDPYLIEKRGNLYIPAFQKPPRNPS